jgi:NitT/TauT family transport system substrate-binding protein
MGAVWLSLFALFIALTASLNGAISTARAQETIKMIMSFNSWDNQGTLQGRNLGIFKKRGLELDITNSEGTGETLQAVISGSVDIGAGVGIAGAMSAYAKGAPVRVLAPSYTGARDIYWYVRTDSPIKTLKDATEKDRIAYSNSGSTAHNIVTAFGREFGVKAKPTATGGPSATQTLVMSGQIEIGWSAFPLGIQDIKDGRIRIIARGSDVPSMRNQTLRVLLVNANALKTRKEAMVRFIDAYREGVDWIFTSPEAIKNYAITAKLPEALIRESIGEFQPREAMQTDRMEDLDQAMKDAIQSKFLVKPLTAEEIAEFIQIPPRRQ